MKTVHLIALLTEDERKELQTRLKAKKRPSLVKLYQHLTGTPTPHTGKEQLYKTSFGQKYSPAKDYLLRNELRLLNEAVESLLTEKETGARSHPIQNNLYLLERMLRLGEVQLFKNLFAETERLALNAQAHAQLVNLYDLWVNHAVRHKEVSVQHYEEILHYLHLRRLAAERLLRETHAEIELRRNHSLKVIQALEPERHPHLANTDSHATVHHPEPVAEYYQKYAHSYLLKGDEKIAAYHELIALQPHVAKLRPARQKDLATLYGNLALELFLGHRHQEADGYYTIALEHLQQNEVYLDLYFNYCVNALLIGKHREVTEIYAKHFHEIERSEKLRYRFACFTAIAYLMLGNPERSFGLLHPEIASRPVTEYYYYRLVYAMVYYQKGDMENAEREIDNILQSFRFRKTAKLEDKPLVKLMKKMVDTEYLRPQREKHRAETEKLRAEVLAHTAKVSQFSTVIYNWIVWQIGGK